MDVEQRIFIIRGMKVMIDRDLAELYGVETKHLNRQVKRNRERFPEEFMFQLTRKEKDELVTNWHRFEPLKHSVVLPYAFTEHGVAMLATVLKSDQAVRMSILIVKAFVRLREVLIGRKELAEKLKLLELHTEKHDREINAIVEAIKHLIEQPEPSKRQIGFKVEDQKAVYAPRKKVKR
jgi:hypothetical protein